MFEPCYEHCLLRYGKGYTKECDEKCSYAKVALEKRKLEENIAKILDYVQRRENAWYDRADGTDCVADELYLACAYQYQQMRYYIEELVDEQHER